MGVRYRDYQYVGSLYDVDQSIGETSKQATAQRRAHLFGDGVKQIFKNFQFRRINFHKHSAA